MVLTSSICENQDQSSHRNEALRSVQSLPRTTQVVFENHSGRAVARLREPRHLYGVSGHVSQTVPRWPQECVVIPRQIHHIEWAPSKPEPLYEQVKTIITAQHNTAETNTEGIIVYSTEEVKENYFSGSCVGGSHQSALSPGAVSLTGPDDTTLLFEGRFESGNLLKAVKVGEFDYELHLRTDLYTKKHTQWFYFQVRNTRACVRYRFTITNMMKMTSLYKSGQLPLLYSEEKAKSQGVGWHRVGQRVSYYRNGRQNFNRPCYSLSWCLRFPCDQDTCYLANCYPYTYSNMWAQLSEIERDARRSRYCKVRTLCRTLAGNLVPVLTVTNPSSQKESDGSTLKPAVVLTARVHPGETNSSWVMKGILKFLLEDSPDAAMLRDTFVFKVVPMLNPDGVIVGNSRCSLIGRDLNRKYKSSLKELFPTVCATRSMVQRLCEKGKVLLYCDLHGHSRKQNIFTYGCENLGLVQNPPHERIFPLMLSKNCPDLFSFQDCKFKVKRSKEGTGRVALWRLGVVNSFTLEISFCGSSTGQRTGTHFNTQDLETMGFHFCDTLLDFCDPNRSKYIACLRELREIARPCVDFADQSSDTANIDHETSTSGSSGNSDSDEPPVDLYSWSLSMMNPHKNVKTKKKKKRRRRRTHLLNTLEMQDDKDASIKGTLENNTLTPESTGTMPDHQLQPNAPPGSECLPGIEHPNREGRASPPEPNAAPKKPERLQRLMEEYMRSRMLLGLGRTGNGDNSWGSSQAHGDARSLAHCVPSALLLPTLHPAHPHKEQLTRQQELSFQTPSHVQCKPSVLWTADGVQMQIKSNRLEVLEPVREFAVPISSGSAGMDWVFLPSCPLFTSLVTGEDEDVPSNEEEGKQTKKKRKNGALKRNKALRYLGHKKKT